MTAPPDTGSALYVLQSLPCPPGEVVRQGLLWGSLELCPQPRVTVQAGVARARDMPVAPGHPALSGASGSESLTLLDIGSRWWLLYGWLVPCPLGPRAL